MMSFVGDVQKKLKGFIFGDFDLDIYTSESGEYIICSIRRNRVFEQRIYESQQLDPSAPLPPIARYKTALHNPFNWKVAIPRDNTSADFTAGVIYGGLLALHALDAPIDEKHVNELEAMESE